MVYAVIGDQFGNEEQRYAYPTALYVRRTAQQLHARLGRKALLRAQALPDGRNLFEAYSTLPPHRDVFAWSSFLGAYLPLLEPLLQAKRWRRLRRARLHAYIRRDRVCDQIIRDLLGGSLSSEARKEVHIAYGSGAAVSSSGFGAPPAPQQRLLWRMQQVHHGLKVTMVDEYRTSQICSNCLVERLYAAKAPPPSLVSGRPDAAAMVRPIGEPCWKLRACPRCKNSQDTGPLVLHRDLNAARNIRACFLAEAEGGEGLRPQALRRAAPPPPDAQ